MVETIITLADTQIRCGVVSVFTVDEEGYAALVPLKEDNTPAKADIIIVGCEFDEDDECSFYELEDEEEPSIYSPILRRCLQQPTAHLF